MHKSPAPPASSPHGWRESGDSGLAPPGAGAARSGAAACVSGPAQRATRAYGLARLLVAVSGGDEAARCCRLWLVPPGELAEEGLCGGRARAGDRTRASSWREVLVAQLVCAFRCTDADEADDAAWRGAPGGDRRRGVDASGRHEGELAEPGASASAADALTWELAVPASLAPLLTSLNEMLLGSADAPDVDDAGDTDPAAVVAQDASHPAGADGVAGGAVAVGELAGASAATRARLLLLGRHALAFLGVVDLTLRWCACARVACATWHCIWAHGCPSCPSCTCLCACIMPMPRCARRLLATVPEAPVGSSSSLQPPLPPNLMRRLHDRTYLLLLAEHCVRLAAPPPSRHGAHGGAEAGAVARSELAADLLAARRRALPARLCVYALGELLSSAETVHGAAAGGMAAGGVAAVGAAAVESDEGVADGSVAAVSPLRDELRLLLLRQLSGRLEARALPDALPALPPIGASGASSGSLTRAQDCGGAAGSSSGAAGSSSGVAGSNESVWAGGGTADDGADDAACLEPSDGDSDGEAAGWSPSSPSGGPTSGASGAVRPQPWMAEALPVLVRTATVVCAAVDQVRSTWARTQNRTEP